MKAELRRVGRSQSPVVVIDDFTGDIARVRRLADELAPFPAIEDNYYPGVRRVITNADERAYAYVLETCTKAAPAIGGAFGVPGFDLEQASFSIVTLEPGRLQPLQRAPHFDGPEQNLLALLHYVRVPAGSGTAFYRHRATGVERVTKVNVHAYLAHVQAELPKLAPDSGYVGGSNETYEEIGRVEAVPDRLIIYHGSLLHSGVISADTTFSADPAQGRLTANFFLLGR